MCKFMFLLTELPLFQCDGVKRELFATFHTSLDDDDDTKLIEPDLGETEEVDGEEEEEEVSEVATEDRKGDSFEEEEEEEGGGGGGGGGGGEKEEEDDDDY